MSALRLQAASRLMRNLEATATVQQSGHWSVVLGRNRWLRRFVVDSTRSPIVSEDQLGLLALGIGSELLRRLSSQGETVRRVRVWLFGTTRAADGISAGGSVLHIQGVLTVGTEAHRDRVNRWIPELLKSTVGLNCINEAVRIERLEVATQPDVMVYLP